MYSEINQKLNIAKEGMNRHDKIVKMLSSLNEELSEMNNKLIELEYHKKKEEKEYEDIQNSSIRMMFYRILGSDEKRLEKERQEALAAKLKHEQCLYDISELERRMNALTKEKELITNCKMDYRMLFEEKKALLEKENPMISGRLMELAEKEAECKSDCKEIEEAIRVGEEVLQVLEDAIDSLDSAKGWGTWDLLGGGFISDMAKHSHIDDAKNSVEHVQSLLRSFRSELTDINIQDDLHIDISDFSKFADFFFDGLIADWSMQSKIDNSLQSVTSVRDTVDSILAKLRNLKRSALLKEADINSQKEGIILKA